MSPGHEISRGWYKLAAVYEFMVQVGCCLRVYLHIYRYMKCDMTGRVLYFHRLLGIPETVDVAFLLARNFSPAKRFRFELFI